MVKELRNNLLELPAIEKLGLVVQVNTIAGDFATHIKQKYSALFEGLGVMGEPYEIKLKQGAKPVCLFTPRRIPFALRKKYKKSYTG